jgi:hypothetical protein
MLVLIAFRPGIEPDLYDHNLVIVPQYLTPNALANFLYSHL